MAAVPSLEDVPGHGPALARIGFTPHENGMTGRLPYVRAPGGVRTHILHVVASAGPQPAPPPRLPARPPEEAARYAGLKRGIAAAGTVPGRYTEAKTALVQELTDRARRERGLPPGPVWEK